METFQAGKGYFIPELNYSQKHPLDFNNNTLHLLSFHNAFPKVLLELWNPMARLPGLQEMLFL